MSSKLGYAEALDTLRAALRFGIHPSLDAITVMAEKLGRPQDSFVSLQITGTNGKSSTARMTAALLSAHGLSTGLYTSPELHSYTERIEIDGVAVSEDEFAAAIAAAQEAANKGDVVPTEFELLTAAALWLYRERGIDIAVLEVGMGGRWDATSVVTPAVSVITGVGLDHTEHLGSTREAIAFDKAHIIKEGSSAILGPGTLGVEEVLFARTGAMHTHARAVRPAGTPSPCSEELTTRYEVLSRPNRPDGVTVLDVVGAHATYASLSLSAPMYQAGNAATAIAAAEAALGHALDKSSVSITLATIRFPGRFEVVATDPFVVLDGAHNPQAAAVLAGAIEDAWPASLERPVVLLGVLADKDAEGIVTALSPVAGRFACVAPDSPRALPAEKLAAVVERVSGRSCTTYSSVASALQSLVVDAKSSVVVTGSLRTVAEGQRVAVSGIMNPMIGYL